MKRSTLTARLVLVIATLIPLSAWAQAIGANGPVLPNPGRPGGITREDQITAGQHAMAQVYQQMPVLSDSSPVTRYVQQLGKKLEAQIPSNASWPYQFHVVQQSDINAFALPGGPIFINVGTINAAASEAELAGVIGHEMSHVYLQHSAKQAGKVSTAQGVLGVLGAILGGSTAGKIATTGIAVGAQTLFLKYSRQDEAQADATGAIIMYKAGYDPHAMAEFFQKLEQQGGASAPQFLSDHPNPGNRVAAVDREVQNWPPKTFHNDSSAFASARQNALKVQTYTAQQISDGAKQGVWARQNQQNGAMPKNMPAPAGGNPAGNQATIGNVSWNQVKPSGTFTQLQANGLSISYPDNWQAGNDSNSGGVTIAPAAGAVNGAVAYGVVIGSANVNASTLDQATQQIIQGLQQSNPGLQATGNASNINVNGMQAQSVDLTGTSPIQKNGQPEAEHDWLVTVSAPQGSVVYLVFIAPQNQFGRLKSTYQQMLNSLQLQ